MANLYLDSAVVPAGRPGRYGATLSEPWSVWGPNGGHLAAVGLQAAMAASRLPRPASLHCHYLSVGAFGPVEVEVTVLGGGKRAESLRVDVRQDERLLLAASVWMIDEGMGGFVHDAAEMPAVPLPGDLLGMADLVDNYDEWYPIWRSMEGRPTEERIENPPPRDPVSRTWMRLTDTPMPDDPTEAARADAVRQVFWMDYPGWNATIAAHPWPFPYLTPNLDLTVQFHRGSPGEEWTLADGVVAVAEDGLVGCVTRLWTPDGQLVATGTSQHTCRPNPSYADDVALAEQRRAES